MARQALAATWVEEAQNGSAGCSVNVLPLGSCVWEANKLNYTGGFQVSSRSCTHHTSSARVLPDSSSEQDDTTPPRDVPVVFYMNVALGAACPSYQLYSLLQARRLNPRVVILTTKPCRAFALRANTTFVDIGSVHTPLSDRVVDVLPKTIQKYAYERNNHLQWLHRSELVRRMRVPWALHCDSDVLLGVDAASIIRAVHAQGGRLSTRGGCTVLRSDVLHMLAHFYVDVYKAALLSPAICAVGLATELTQKHGNQQSVCDDMTVNTCFSSGCLLSTYYVTIPPGRGGGTDHVLHLHLHVDAIDPHPIARAPPIDLRRRGGAAVAVTDPGVPMGNVYTAPDGDGEPLDGILRGARGSDDARWQVVAWQPDGTLAHLDARSGELRPTIALHFVGGNKGCLRWYWKQMSRVRRGRCVGCTCRPYTYLDSFNALMSRQVSDKSWWPHEPLTQRVGTQP